MLNKRIGAFSIAEMLVVLVIVSVLAIGLPMVHFKKTELKTKRSYHGRYECFYDGNQLKEYMAYESGVSNGPDNVTSCTFTPPKTAIYFLVHAVGGGGGGTLVPSAPTIINDSLTTSYRRSSVHLFPQWLQDVTRANQSVNGTYPIFDIGSKTTYDTKISGKRATISYGVAGQPGQTVSMFFPSLRNTTIEMLPGQGGAVGNPGGATTVKFNGITIITAPGGQAGTGTGGTMRFWVDGPGSMCAVNHLITRKYKEADFSDSIELDTGIPVEAMHSKLVDAKAGAGGPGGYGNVTDVTSLVTYTVKDKDGNEINVSDYVERMPGDCNNPEANEDEQYAVKCDDGTGNGPINATCASSAGKNGAVMILW